MIFDLENSVRAEILNEISKSVENLCNFIELSILLDEEEIKLKSIFYLSLQASQTLDWGLDDLTERGMEEILKLEKISITEYELFRFVVKWAETSKGDNLRDNLGHLLYNIRFPTMSEEQIKYVFEDYPDLFTDEEKEEIFDSKNCSKLYKFSSIPRSRAYDNNEVEFPFVGSYCI